MKNKHEPIIGYQTDICCFYSSNRQKTKLS